MKKFALILKDVNDTLNRFFVAERIIEAVIVFLGVFLALFFIKFYPGMAIIPALVYLGVKVHTDIRRKKWRMVEDSYRPLDEKLRTAADNVSRENPIVDALQQEVAGELRNVRLSSFVNLRRMGYKTLAIVALCFLILMMARFDLHVPDLPFLEGLRPDLKSIIGGKGKDLGGEDIVGATETEESDIFGKKSVAKIGTEEIKIQIKPAGNEIDIRDVSEIEEKEFEESFPDEISVESGTVFKETIPTEQQDLVKAYFENLAKGK